MFHLIVSFLFLKFICPTILLNWVCADLRKKRSGGIQGWRLSRVPWCCVQQGTCPRWLLDDDRCHDEITAAMRMIRRARSNSASAGACSWRNMCLACDMAPELNMLLVTLVI